MRRVTYEVPVNGLATDFTESELPLNFALRFKNRFINRLGGAEKRRGLTQTGNNLPDPASVTGIHEHVDEVGNTTLLASYDGKIYRFDDPGWTLVHTMGSSGRLRSAHFQDKLVFFNGVDRQEFTEDGTIFKELKALIEVGLGGDETAANRLNDADITDWNTATNAAVNDIVYYPDLSAYGIITSVSASAVNHTAVSANGTGLGDGTGTPNTGEPYEIIDLVPLNLVDNGVELDNTAVGTSGTSTTTVAVSGVDFSDGEARIGDFVRNTTRSAVAQIEAIGVSALTVTTVASQTTGDSFVFLKSAMPIAYHMHVHYDRAYYVDSRDRRNIIVSDTFDAQGLTADSGSLDDVTFFAGALQPQGDVIVTLGSYQNFFVIGGEHNIYLYSGTVPIGTNADFVPQALFPQGVISQDGMLTIGNDLVFVGHDGVQTVSQISDASQLGRDTLTFPISNTLRDELDSVPRDEIILFHYRQRSWIVLKVGATMYVLNYSTRADESGGAFRENLIELAKQGSISLFDGLLAQGASFLERRNDQLLVGCAGGKVCLFDQDGIYTDDSAIYATDFQTGWLLLEPPGRKSVNYKSIKYIEPIFEGNASIEYEITGIGGFDFDSSEIINVAASSQTSQVGTAVIPSVIGGAAISSVKHSLRVRGQAIQIRFATADNKGPDTISRFTLYAAIHGAR